MITLEFKAYGKKQQYLAIDEAIRTARFILLSCIRYWMDNFGINKYELSKYSKVLADQFPFAGQLNSTARQASSERAWSSISRFFDNCKKKTPGKKGYPKFQKRGRSVEYKQSGWKLSPDKKSITFTDKKGIGKLKLKGTWDLWRFAQKQIKRVRIVRRADGYYVQFCIQVNINEELEPTGNIIGLDVGLKDFYTDSDGKTEPNPRFYRTGSERLKFYQRRVSRKTKGSSNRKKAVKKLGKTHLKISRQREEHAKRLARCVIRSNDLVAYEDLKVRNLVKNHCLAKSINDAGWYQFREWIEHFGQKFGRVTVAVNPAYTSQKCSNCGEIVRKSLSTRTHVCKCGCKLDRDHNAAINILKRADCTVGHTGTLVLDQNACGELSSTRTGSGLVGQDSSVKQESPSMQERGVSKMSKAVILLSGGLDSATTAAIALADGWEAIALSFNYGQRHSRELEAAQNIAKTLKIPEHFIVDVNLSQWGGSSLTDRSFALPQDGVQPGVIPSTYVPGRNTVFIAIALSLAEAKNAEAIYLGINAIDYSGYPDCRPEYLFAYQQLANLSSKVGTEGTAPQLIAPLIKDSKVDIVRRAVALGVPIELTWSCYKGGSEPCGLCDSCRIRDLALIQAGYPQLATTVGRKTIICK